MPVELRRLTPTDLGQLILLDQKLFPPAFRIDHALISTIIDAELRGRNRSVGAFDKGRLIGYMIIIRKQSEFNPKERVCLFITMAVARAYRREAVVPLLSWVMRETILSGYMAEGCLRETTSYRMILRNWALFRRFGFRIVTVTPRPPVNNERMILLHFEHIFSRDPVLRPVYYLLTRINSLRHIVVALPRRILRRICERMPEEALPPWLRRMTFLEIEMPAEQPVSKPHRAAA